MAVPQMLILEMRAAFRACRVQGSRTMVKGFSSCGCDSKQATASTNSKRQTVSRPPTIPQAGIVPSSARTPPPPPPPPSQNPSTSNIKPRDAIHRSPAERKLVPVQADRRTLDTPRQIPVPYKVIPQENLTPNLKLNPRERLHIEALTRRLPTQPSDKKIYQPRIQIYHCGTAQEMGLSMLKVLGIFGASLTTFIFAPAHLAAGTHRLLVLTIFLGGFVPLALTHFFTKPQVTKIFLNLPSTARESSKRAMEYARNLPASAELDIWFARPWALQDKVVVRLDELAPASGAWYRPLTFAWVEKYTARRGGGWWKNPREFFVRPKTAVGVAAPDTIPGVWEGVYRKLTGVESDAVAKWRR